MKNSIYKLDDQGYKKFGLLMALTFVFLFGLALPWIFSYSYPTWPWAIATIFIIMALAKPISLAKTYFVWMKFGQIMSWFNTKLILGILFYGMILPIGLLLKIFGKVPISKEFNKGINTYRKLSKLKNKEHMENPF